MRTILVVVALLTAAPASAQLTHENCEDFGEISESVMRMRQAGAPMSQSMRLAEIATGPIRNAIEVIIEEAYWRPRMSTERNQQREIENFRSDIEFQCFRAIKDNQ
jgi:hypothetical protein